MEQFLQQLQTIPETAELIRRVEGGRLPGGGQRTAAGAESLCGRCGGPGDGPPAVFVCGDEREVRQLSGDLRTLMEQEPVQLLAREWQFRPARFPPGSGNAAVWRRCMPWPGDRHRWW